MLPTILRDSQAELAGQVTGFHPGDGTVSPSSSTTQTSQTSNRNFSIGMGLRYFNSPDTRAGTKVKIINIIMIFIFIY